MRTPLRRGHPASMTHTLPASKRRRPWSHRTRPAADLALAIPHDEWDSRHRPPSGCVRYSANC
ncbi:hypothetical protein E0E62_22365 [Streptomyces sp. 16-176A]